MDPALWELCTSSDDPWCGANREIEAIVRLDRPGVVPTGVRIVSNFGRVATCRIPAASVLAVRRDGHVRSLKASRRLVPDRHAANGSRSPSPPTTSDRRRPPHLSLTGAGVVVGVVDWGCDLDHPNFQRPDGSTRLLALWDQRDTADRAAPTPYGYGAVHSRRRIDHALRTGLPYDALGYHPADADRDGMGTHGTHVLDIAAGNGRNGGPVGIAPEAELVFVHLANRGTRGLATLGDSVRLLEAVDFIRRTAADRPWVINISIGNHGGPHDGSSLVELALDELLRAAPGRAVCMSAGNYLGARAHATRYATAGEQQQFTFVVDAADLTANELEVWYSGDDQFRLKVMSPTGAATATVDVGGAAPIIEDGRTVGRIYHRAHDPNNGDHHVDLFLYPTAPSGPWTVTFEPVRIYAGVLHAWLERDDQCRPCQARFVPTDTDARSTTGTIANGRLPLTVGAYDAHSAGRALAPFSSSGPTRDGRIKPDLVAPGVRVLAARSAPVHAARGDGMLVRKSGTSMAAPHVAGAVALCLQAAPELRADELRELVLGTASPHPADGDVAMRHGRGSLDSPRLHAALTRRIPTDPTDPKETTMSTLEPDLLSLGADRLYREMAYRPDGPVAQRIRAAYTVVAAPGEPPSDMLRPGDVLVRVALGVPGAGQLALVVDDGSAPRRPADRSGRMPLGQLLLRPTPCPCTGGVIDVEAPADGWPADDDLDAGDEAVLRTGPLDDSEWGLLEMWLSAGQVGTDDLTGDAEANATLVAGAIFCGRKIGTPDTRDDPLLCVDPAVTAADPRARALKAHVVARGPIINWARVPVAQRRAHVMNLLVTTHGYPVNGAAGLVGNLYAESKVLPNMIEGATEATPMRARDFRRVRTDFSASDVMNRNRRAQRGPRRAGIGLAQWTFPARRAGLFAHRHDAKPSGARILFDMDAQVDYLVNELRTSYPAVDNALRDPAVTVDDASDDVVYDFERPGSILHNGVRLPRTHPAVQDVFRDRRRFSRTALADHQPAPAPAVQAPGPTGAEADEDIFNRQCGFVTPAGSVVTEAALRAAVVDVASDERLRWLNTAGTRLLQERVVDQFGHLVRYRLGTVNAMLPSTLTHVQGVATNGTINYRPLLVATGTAAVNAAAAAIRVQLLAGAPGVGTPANLDALVDRALQAARKDRADRTPWSSAFVSDCIRRVAVNLGLESDVTGTHQGRDVLLRSSGGHRFYLHEAHRRTSGPGRREGTYHAFEPADRAVRRGDIIVQDRQADHFVDVWTYRRIPTILPGRELHGDIVVDVVAGDHAVTIGGNLGESVSRRRYPLDADDRLVVARSRLYTQEANNTVFPPWPATSTADLHGESTARIFALLSPVPSCFIVPSPLFGGPAA